MTWRLDVESSAVSSKLGPKTESAYAAKDSRISATRVRWDFKEVNHKAEKTLSERFG